MTRVYITEQNPEETQISHRTRKTLRQNPKIDHPKSPKIGQHLAEIEANMTTN